MSINYQDCRAFCDLLKKLPLKDLDQLLFIMQIHRAHHSSYTEEELANYAAIAIFERLFDLEKTERWATNIQTALKTLKGTP